MMTSPRTGFAPVNGLSLYYEIHGSGEPLVMLHGGIGASEMLGPNLAELARTRQVIVPHMQGHGFTKDIDRPYDSARFADDLAALLDHLGIRRADVMGYSLGAGIAIRLAIQHPDRVRRLIPVSGMLSRAGQYPETLDAFPEMVRNAAEIGASVAASPLGEMYPDVDWETAFRKTGVMASQDWDWTEEAATIRAPVLLVFADADCMTGEHIVAMYRAFGGFARDASYDGSLRPEAQLAILPGRTHYNILQATEVASLVERFLRE